MTEIILTEQEGREMDQDCLLNEVYLKQCPACKTLYFNHIVECVGCKLDLVVYSPLKTKAEEQKMATLRDEAQAYEPPQTLNIADLDKIPIDIEVKQGQGKDKDGEVFNYLYAEIDKKQYRIAGSILGGIKAILKKMPNLKFVSVIKQGQGMNTRYQVIPYTEMQAETVFVK